MRKIILLSIATLTLAACGGGGKASIVKSCVDEGESKKTCTCLADAIEENTDEKTFKLIAKAAKSGGMEEGLEDLPMDKKMALAMTMVGAATKCSK
ncbi:hypothetical protein [Hirschia litorea]|uniref:Lipoprotein n=1 Tax=Hirschia litorea TaxID=1199156 RepID=A0ABW2IJN5_9PROT